LAYAQLRGDIRIVIGQSFGEPLDEAQLAFTLAHELTHILGQHYQRSVARQKEINSQVMANPTLSATAAVQMRNAFRRTLESEADRNAAQWLLRAGYSLANIEQLIQQLPEATGLDEGSYPTRKERLASIR
jgi:predicted Zn-dependent protease